MIPNNKKKIAVIGSGVSGLSAAWLLSKKHEITLFEKCSKAGGHANTRIISTSNGNVPVDSGFIVYNEQNYPNLAALFLLLGVPTTVTEMSFAFSRDEGRYEYNGSGLKGLFGQKTNMIRSSHWRMIQDIQRFFSESGTRILGYDENIELGAFLKLEGFSEAFLDNHILPMAGAIWSSPADQMKVFPAKSFLDFYANHGLLQANNRPKWRSIAGGSEQYLNRLIADSNFYLKLDCPVSSVQRRVGNVTIQTQDGQAHHFDEVVFACHADAALKMLTEPSQMEERLLGNFSYSSNQVVMHRDKTLMPKRRRLWASWNYLTNSEQFATAKPSSVTYWMNSLQQLDTKEDIFVSVNPGRKIDQSKMLFRTEYRHPVFDVNAMKAQKMLWQLQGTNRSWFCGSYFGYGFHEDGLQSGLAVAEQVGGLKRPWNVSNESARIHLCDQSMLDAAE